METAAGITTASIATTVITAARVSVPTASVVPTATVISRAAIISAMAPIGVIPRARAYKYSAAKPLRTVVSIRRTTIRIIVVVPILTDRRPRKVSRAYPNDNSYPDFRLGICKRHHQNCQQSKIFQITHMDPLGSRPGETGLDPENPSNDCD